MSIIVAFYYAVLIISISKLIVRLILSISYNLKKTRNTGNHPSISVIVPAYNEETTIARCVQSILDLDYPDFEVIVVDDGSTDSTLATLNLFKSPRLTVVHQENQGKSNALNNGIRLSESEIIITVDADTTIHSAALKKVAGRFASVGKLGAVAGNIKVALAPGVLNALQATEYTVGINLIRKTQSMLGCVMIVPGPIAAIKKKALQSVGLFSNDTFAEDFDVTMKLLEAGYSVEYEEDAIAYTDAPKTLEDLVKQRRRWYRGMIQVLDKYRGMYLRPRYGLVGIVGVPNLWFDTTLPLINLAMILLAALSGIYSGEVYISLMGLASYFGLDIAIGVFALSLDPVKRLREFLAVSLLSLYNIFLDGVRLMSLVEEMADTEMTWETPKR